MASPIRREVFRVRVIFSILPELPPLLPLPLTPVATSTLISLPSTITPEPCRNDIGSDFQFSFQLIVAMVHRRVTTKFSVVLNMPCEQFLHESNHQYILNQGKCKEDKNQGEKRTSLTASDASLASSIVTNA